MNEAHHGEDQLIAFALGELEETESALVESHLTSCAHCRETVASLSGAIDAVRHAPPPEPPASTLVELLAGQGNTVRHQRRSWWRLTTPARWLPASLPAAATVAVLLLASFWAGRLSVSTPAPSHPAAASRADSSAVFTRPLPEAPRIPFESTVMIENS